MKGGVMYGACVNAAAGQGLLPWWLGWLLV
jgi:hypothetical protein